MIDHDVLRARMRRHLSFAPDAPSNLSALQVLSLLDEIAALRADAERYRYARQIDRADSWSSLLAPNVITSALDIDAAIDRARGAT